MATGRPAFEGRSQASLIAAILEHEPQPMTASQPMAPPALERLVRTCLAKDPDERVQTAHDVKLQLQWIAEAGSQAGIPAPLVARRKSRERLGWIFAVALLVPLIVALAPSIIHLRESPPKARPIRFLVPAPEKVTLNWFDLPMVSPDGERLAFTGSRDRKNFLWLRPLDSVTARLLPDTEGALFPFWSPDGRSIGYFAGGKLKRINLTGGPSQTLCDIPNMGGGTWNRSDVIVFSSGKGLHRVSAGGGEARPVLDLDQSRRETSQGLPFFLPDGRRFLYLSLTAEPGQGAVYVGSLDSKETRRVLPVESNVAYAPPGLLLFARGNTLMAQPFDASRLEIAGDAYPIAEQLAVFAGGAHGASFSVSENGVLAYRTGSAAANTQLVWFDRGGNRVGTLGEPGDYSNPSLSPDEKRVAVGRRDPQAKTRDIWLFDLARGTASRLTFDPADDFNPVWSPDGTRIAFSSNRRKNRDIYQRLASGAGDDELLLESPDEDNVEDWSADGKFILFNSNEPGRSPDVLALPLFGDRNPIPLLKNPLFIEAQAQLSPNGKWMAYYSNESGRNEVYVQNFPPSAGKWQVSNAGGDNPQWRRDGKELFYLQDAKLMAVEVNAGPTNFEAGIPKTLFEIRLSAQQRNRYLVADNGRRFLVNMPYEEATASPITVVVNWITVKDRNQ